ncbi:MAG TPA: DUF2007 domain-containing protein [Actinomycetota bacterium]|nr:DUF2007 domain-containing protein [Actinomycetota bacterium]
MAPDPEWIELTKTVGEINARLLAGELETEGIRVHLEMASAVWLYGAEDPNKLVTIYVQDEDLERAERLLAEAEAGRAEPAYEVETAGILEFEPEPGVYADRERGLRNRALRWIVAAVVAAALLYGLLANVLNLFR